MFETATVFGRMASEDRPSLGGRGGDLAFDVPPCHRDDGRR
jgi:hypothetical protein